VAGNRVSDRVSRAVLRVAVFGLAALLAATVGLGLTYNSSASLPIGLYKIRPLKAEPTRGDVVGVCLRGHAAALARERGYVHAEGLQPWVYGVRCSGSLAVIGKPVAGIPGDTVEVSEQGVSVNGKPLRNGAVRTRDQRGRPLPQARRGVRVLRRGEFWMQSQHSGLSYDSRIFGPILREQIVDRRVPLLTRGGDWGNP
jgi:conjugative transfer signal peptidase TraF